MYENVSIHLNDLLTGQSIRKESYIFSNDLPNSKPR